MKDGDLRIIRSARRKRKLLKRGEFVRWDDMIDAWVWEVGGNYALAA